MQKKGKIEQYVLKQLAQKRMNFMWLFLGLLLGIYLDWTTVEIIIFLIFLWSILGPIASRFLVVPALILFSLVPPLLYLKREERAEEFAIYGYYFLVMLIIQVIIEFKKEKSR
jgi:hypothetical protein